MSREDIPRIGFIVVLLIGGLLIGQQLMDPPESAHEVRAPEAQRTENPVTSTETGQRTFRHWFWESRSLDLAVQVGLIFVGALGIAALLPRSREDEVE